MRDKVACISLRQIKEFKNQREVHITKDRYSNKIVSIWELTMKLLKNMMMSTTCIHLNANQIIIQLLIVKTLDLLKCL